MYFEGGSVTVLRALAQHVGPEWVNSEELRRHISRYPRNGYRIWLKQRKRWFSKTMVQTITVRDVTGEVDYYSKVVVPIKEQPDVVQESVDTPFIRCNCNSHGAGNCTIVEHRRG